MSTIVNDINAVFTQKKVLAVKDVIIHIVYY